MRHHSLYSFFLITLLFISCQSTETKDSEPNKIKNVLFIIADDLKADALGCYGNTVCQTPNIDRLAAQALQFESAYCQGTWCAPSRRSFMFSRYVDTAGVNMGEHFKRNGYYTARIGKIYHMKVPGDIIAGTDGLDHPASWTERFNSQGQEAHTPGPYACLNLDIFTDAPENRQSTAMPHRMFVTVQDSTDGTEQPDHKSATKAIELLRKHKDEPFFLAVGLIRPHYPMVAPDTYFEQYDWEDINLPEVTENDVADIPKIGHPPHTNANNSIGKYPDNQKRMWEGYYASTSFMDAQVGRILDELDRLGLRETTAIVFTSDHGYHLGEHTFWEKSTLHENVARVPLLVAAPGYVAGKTTALTELMDLHPTLSQLAGLDVSATAQGKSLVPVLQNPNQQVRKAALTVGRKGHLLRSENWAYMRYQDGSEELYDMQNDIMQFDNLAEDSKYLEILQEQQMALEAHLRTYELSE